jgi:adenosine deaminase
MVYQLGRKHGVEKIRTRSDAEWCLYFSTPSQFFECFLYVSNLMRTPEDIYQAARDLGARLNAENIRYIEITLAPQKFVRAGIAYPDLIDAADRGLLDSRDEQGREHRFIIDVVRDLGPEIGMETVRLVERHPHPRVVAIGLGGGEQHPAAASEGVFRYAEAIGLQKTAHAGEGRGPESIWEAIRTLGVKRIDHGVRAREDRKLVDYLAEHRIALNLCPSSNVMLGVVSSLEDHPIHAYHRQGIPVNVSTDDPAFFRTTLTEELAKMTAYQAFAVDDIPVLIENALRASFLPDTDKTQWIARFREETQRLTAANGRNSEADA